MPSNSPLSATDEADDTGGEHLPPGGAVLAWVLVDPQRWFGDDFAAKPTAAAAADDSERAAAIKAVVDNVASRCVDASEQIACGRNLVGAERLAPGEWRIVLARHGYSNWCLTAHVGATGISIEPTSSGIEIECSP